MPQLRNLIGLFTGYGSLAYMALYCRDFLTIIPIFVLMFIVGNLVRGSEQNILFALFGIFKPDIIINGHVEEGFELVKQEFEKNFKLGLEQGAQCVVYYQGKKVVDLYGIADTYAYDQNTLQNIYSCTKNVTAIVIAMFVDRGLIKYEDKIVQHWPEFGKGSEEKKQITIEQLLKHESGLDTVVPFISPEISSRVNIKKNAVGQIFENNLPKWNQKSKRSYHAVTRGSMLNEIVRRVDPKKRTIGEFLEEELSGPLGIDAYISVPPHKLVKVKDLCESYSQRKLWAIMQSFLPIGSLVFHNYKNMMLVWKWIRQVIGIENGGIDYNSIKVRYAELPSSNGHANARAVGMLTNLMAMKGKVGNKQFFSESTWEQAHSNVELKLDCKTFKFTKFNKGGFGVFDKESGYDRSDQGFVGWVGLGGCNMQWHPEEQIGFAYTMNLLDCDISHQRGFRLKEAAYKCVKKLQENQKKNE